MQLSETGQLPALLRQLDQIVLPQHELKCFHREINTSLVQHWKAIKTLKFLQFGDFSTGRSRAAGIQSHCRLDRALSESLKKRKIHLRFAEEREKLNNHPTILRLTHHEEIPG